MWVESVLGEETGLDGSLGADDDVTVGPIAVLLGIVLAGELEAEGDDGVGGRVRRAVDVARQQRAVGQRRVLGDQPCVEDRAERVAHLHDLGEVRQVGGAGKCRGEVAARRLRHRAGARQPRDGGQDLELQRYLHGRGVGAVGRTRAQPVVCQDRVAGIEGRAHVGVVLGLDLRVPVPIVREENVKTNHHPRLDCGVPKTNLLSNPIPWVAICRISFLSPDVGTHNCAPMPYVALMEAVPVMCALALYDHLDISVTQPTTSMLDLMSGLLALTWVMLAVAGTGRTKVAQEAPGCCTPGAGLVVAGEAWMLAGKRRDVEARRSGREWNFNSMAAKGRELILPQELSKKKNQSKERLLRLYENLESRDPSKSLSFSLSLLPPALIFMLELRSMVNKMTASSIWRIGALDNTPLKRNIGSRLVTIPRLNC